MSLENMAEALENAPDMGPVPGDQEYRLTLRRLSLNTKEDGRRFIMASIDFPEEPAAEEMGVFVGWTPDDSDVQYAAGLDPEAKANWLKQKARSTRDIKNFFAGFGLPLSLVREFDETQERPTLAAAEGAEARAIVGLRPSKRNPGENENYIKQYMPR